VIAGGGIGGAALAVALQNKGFDVVVLESDSSFDARKQGYGLTIQGYSSTIQALGINLAQDDAPSTSHYTFSDKGEVLGFFGEVFSKSKDRQEPKILGGSSTFPDKCFVLELWTRSGLELSGGIAR